MNPTSPPFSSRHIHKQLLDAVGQAIMATDLDGIIHYWNRAAEDLYGWKAEEVLGLSVVDVIPSASSHEQAAEIMATLRTGDSWTGEFTVRHRDGKSFPAQVTDTPVVDDEGELIGIIGVSFDITARKRTEAALRKSEERYRTIVDTAHEGVWLLDESARTTFVNARMANMLGYTPAEMCGRVFLDFVHRDDRAAGAASFNRRRKGESESYDIRFYRRNGSVAWMLISGSPVYDEAGQFAGSLGMLTDITERKSYERRLIEAKEKAEELARLKTALLTNMSHEIRTPLTGILGFAEIIAANPTDNVREYADFIARSGERLMETLNSVLELAQLECGSVRLQPEQVSLSEIAEDLVAFFERPARRKDLFLRLEQNEPNLRTMADRSALSRVLSNLINNALKFTENGGVTVRLARRGEAVSIEVADTGIGIDAAFVPKLFDDFKQQSEGISRNFEGVGLGLSITRRLVELLGAHIEVKSRRGAGSTFIVTLPSEPAQCIRSVKAA